MGINPELLKLASWRLQNEIEKQSVVGPGGGAPPMDPSMGGAPPMDPSMMGGAPPMDPAMMGGAPPMDPSMMGGAPPMDPSMGGAPPMDPMADIRSIIQEELANAGVGGNGDNGGGGAPKAKKFDPAELDVKLYNMEKLIAAMASALGVSLPPDALLGPPPEGGEDPAAPAAAAPAPAPEEAAPAVPDASSAIKPVEPVQPAMPEVPKMAAYEEEPIPHVGEPIAANSVTEAATLFNKTSALAQMARNLNKRS